jgi:hypothetical protein
MEGPERKVISTTPAPCPPQQPKPGKSAQRNVDAIRPPLPPLIKAVSSASNPVVSIQDTSIFEIPVGTESGDRLLLSTQAFLPVGWAFAASDTFFVSPSDTIEVKIFHDQNISCGDTGKVIIYAYDTLGVFAGNAEVMVYNTTTKGDINEDANFTPADVVCLLNCVFLEDASGACRCDNCVADVNCSGTLTPADVVLELNAVFLAVAFPC